MDENFEDDNFDITLMMRKKKKKKKEFDLDAAFGLKDESTKPNEDCDDNKDLSNAEVDDDLDLDLLGMKKKKKKKKKTPYEFSEMKEALAEDLKEVEDVEKPAESDDIINLDMDFSMAKKKKKKRKDIDDLIEGDEDNKQHNEINVNDNNETWLNSERDYTYDELLKRVFDNLKENNPELAGGRKAKFVMRPPQVLRVGAKKTSFANFMDIAKTLHRMPKHLLDFLLTELGTSGSMDGNQQLIIKGRFQSKQIENVLRRYIKEYVTCHTCRSPETILQKDTRLFFLQCESCGSRCSVASIKSGFQAVTDKRAAMRAKTT